MQLVVFHYHLLPGGVTDVVTHSIQAVTRRRPDISSVRLVCWREENTESVVAALEVIGVPVELDILSEMDYTPPNEAREAALARAADLQAVMLARYAFDDALWWIHNYHVGKNPAFTLALCRIAEMESAPRMLLHIHDFPECARYENLDYLTRITGESPYPAGPTVRYAVINARDKAIMDETGIPHDRTHLLVNPLPAAGDSDVTGPDRNAVVNSLSRYADAIGHTFDPGRPLLLYPVRTIRRKNVLEMVMLARLADDANLIVTLPGVSNAERPYSELISDAYSCGVARGVWGIGRREHEYGLTFDALSRGTDAIVSSSVQEGFGLLFVNALRWRVPLFARNLSILDGVSAVFDGYPAYFYRTATVPMSSPSTKSPEALLRKRYSERLGKLEGLIPPTARVRLDQQLDELIGGQVIDFGFLPPDLQYAYLRDLDDPGFASEVRELNSAAAAALSSVSSRSCPDVSDAVERMFGFDAYADRFDRVMDSFGAAPTGSTASRRYEFAQRTLVLAFADLEYLRLLFAPMGGW